MVDPNDDDDDDMDDDMDDATESDTEDRPRPRARAGHRPRSDDATAPEPRDAPEAPAKVSPSEPLHPGAELPLPKPSAPPASWASEPPRPSEPPSRPSEPPRERPSEHRRDRRESLFRETLRRAVEKSVEAGVETFTKADHAFRGAVGAVEEAKLPREFAGVFFSQLDETKNAVVRVVAREVRDFLDSTDIANEFYRALTSLSFEIKTEVRFIPNDAGGVRPDVRSKVAPKRDKEPRDSRKPRSRGDAESDED